MKNILLIESDIWLKDCYAAWLKPHNLIWAPNAQSTMDLLDENKIDLIILDMFLPFFNGMQILNTLASHADLAKIPVIVLGDELPSADLKKYGVRIVIEKTTITQAQLEQAINEIF